MICGPQHSKSNIILFSSVDAKFQRSWNCDFIKWYFLYLPNSLEFYWVKNLHWKILSCTSKWILDEAAVECSIFILNYHDIQWESCSQLGFSQCSDTYSFIQVHFSLSMYPDFVLPPPLSLSLWQAVLFFLLGTKVCNIVTKRL